MDNHGESIGGLMGHQNAPSEQPSQTTAPSSASNDVEITQLSNMVKNLLSEQAELKDKLAAQEKQLTSIKD